MSKRQARFEVRLNDAQRKAVETIRGPLLCIAGAGTGKTATLVARVAYMIEQGIPPESILLLTFTRKAAAEMLDRAASLFGRKCYEVEGGTFHSFANRLLRQYGGLIGLDTYSIIDQADAEDIIRMQLDLLGFAGKSSGLPSVRSIRNIFGKHVNWGISIEDVLKREYMEYIDEVEKLERLAEQINDYKFQHRLVDFDDLLILACTLLADGNGMARRMASQYQYVMVDEYQDTNVLQADMVMSLGMGHGNVMVVGDDAQSIYAFRGASYRNILEFPDMFSGTEIVRLEENFRSVQPILDATNIVIGQAKESFRKNLYSHREGFPPTLAICQDEQTQSQYVVSAIQRHRAAGLPLSDMAVLVRSGFLSYDLEIECQAAKIPFVKVGGIKFMEGRHIKDILAYIRVLVNPADSLAWFRIFGLIEGVGAKTSRKLYDDLSKQPDPYHWLSQHPGKSRWNDDVCKLGRMLYTVNMTIGVDRQIETIIAYYLPILREAEEADREYARRREGLEYLVSVAESYAGLAEFLSQVALDPPNESANGQTDDPDVDRLTISTIHSAKGLEWNVVFVLWLTEGRFPSLYAYEDDERLEEERRLLYVAMTRAKDHLYLMNPAYFDRRAGMTFSKLSSYLDGIAETHVDRVRVSGDSILRGKAIKPVPQF